jgi:hypothetical protein
MATLLRRWWVAVSSDTPRGIVFWFAEMVALVCFFVAFEQRLASGDVWGCVKWSTDGLLIGLIGWHAWRVPARYEAWKRKRPAPALAPTRKGTAELLLQEPLAQAAVIASLQKVEVALSGFALVAEATTAGNQLTSTLATKGDQAAALLTLDKTWRDHGVATSERLPQLVKCVSEFESAVSKMLECWSSYASKGPRKRDLRRDPSFRGWAEFCAGGMKKRSADILGLKDIVVANARGHNEATDNVIDQFAAILERFTVASSRLSRGASEMLVVLDRTVSWPERIRWKLWRRKRARELERTLRATELTDKSSETVRRNGSIQELRDKLAYGRDTLLRAELHELQTTWTWSDWLDAVGQWERDVHWILKAKVNKRDANRFNETLNSVVLPQSVGVLGDEHTRMKTILAERLRRLSDIIDVLSNRDDATT